jgi:hypothetical protein
MIQIVPYRAAPQVKRRIAGRMANPAQAGTDSPASPTYYNTLHNHKATTMRMF